MSSPKCVYCTLPILPPTPTVTYEHQTYHTHCLICKVCRKSLGGCQFIKEKNGDLVCQECDAKTAPKCTACGKAFEPGLPYKKLTDTVFYHNECFVCVGQCRKPIAAEFYDMENGTFMCTDCYDNAESNYTAPPPPLPTRDQPSHGPNKDHGAIDQLVSNLNININNPSKTNNNNNNTRNNPEVLPAVARDPPPKTSTPAAESAPKCAKCLQTLTGAYTVYNEKKYHTKCFTCCQCDQEFKEKTFFKLDNKPLCKDCHTKNQIEQASKCRKCFEPILDTVVTFKNGEYHNYCLTCTGCSKTLIGQSIYTDKHDKPYCVECFTRKEAKKCEKCKQPIAPSQTSLIFEEKNFHKDCFTCSDCERTISSSEPFYKKDDQSTDIICEACSKKPTSNF